MVHVWRVVQPNDELVSVNLQQLASQCFTSPRVANRLFAQEPNRSTELAVSINPGGPEPSSGDWNCPTQSILQPCACGDAWGRDNLPASGLICPDPIELPLRRIIRTVGPRALTAQGDEYLKESRTQSERSRYSTQTESQPTGESSLNSRRMQSHARANNRVHQPTTRVIQSGLSSASLSWSGKDAAGTKSMSHDHVQFQR